MYILVRVLYVDVIPGCTGVGELVTGLHVTHGHHVTANDLTGWGGGLCHVFAKGVVGDIL